MQNLKEEIDGFSDRSCYVVLLKKPGRFYMLGAQTSRNSQARPRVETCGSRRCVKQLSPGDVLHELSNEGCDILGQPGYRISTEPLLKTHLNAESERQDVDKPCDCGGGDRAHDTDGRGPVGAHRLFRQMRGSLEMR